MRGASPRAKISPQAPQTIAVKLLNVVFWHDLFQRCYFSLVRARTTLLLDLGIQMGADLGFAHRDLTTPSYEVPGKCL